MIISSYYFLKHVITQAYSFIRSLVQKSRFFTRFNVRKSYFSFSNWSLKIKEVSFKKEASSHYFARLLRRWKGHLERNGYSENAAEEVVEFFAPLLVIDCTLSFVESAYSYSSMSVENYFNLETLDFEGNNLTFSMNQQLQSNTAMAGFVYRIEKLQQSGCVVQRQDFIHEFEEYKKEKTIFEITSLFINACISCLDKYVSVVFDNFLKGNLTLETRESAGALVRLCENVIPPLLLSVTLLVTVIVYLCFRMRSISQDLIPLDLSSVTDHETNNDILQAQHDRLLLIKGQIVLSQEVIVELENDILRLRQMRTLIEYAKALDKDAFLDKIRHNYTEHMVMPIVYLKALYEEVNIDLDQVDLVKYVKGNIERLEEKYSIKNMFYIQLQGTLKALLNVVLNQIPSISELVIFTILYNVFCFIAMPQMTIALFVSLIILKPVVKYCDSLIMHMFNMIALSDALWFFRAQKCSVYFGFNTVDNVKVYNQDNTILTPQQKKVFKAKVDFVRQSRHSGVESFMNNSYIFENSHVLSTLLNAPI